VRASHVPHGFRLTVTLPHRQAIDS
jgi:hypothetical protein